LISPLLVIVYPIFKLLSLRKWKKMPLKDPKVVVITGASSGIGEAFAKYYSRPGNVVAITARRKEALAKVAEACERQGATVVQGVLDVTDKAGMESWLKELDDKYPVDLIIANAGGTANTLGVTGDLEAAARKVYNVNIDGTFNTIFPLLERMKTRKSGQIAIMSSVSGLGPVKGMFEYSSSKSALKVFAESLRWLLYRDGVHVNALVPGFFDSALTEKNQGAMPFKDKLENVVQYMVKGLARDQPVIYAGLAAPTFGWLLLHVLPDDARDCLAKVGASRLISYHGSRSKGGLKRKEVKKEE